MAKTSAPLAAVDRHIARRAGEQRKQISLHHLSRLLDAYRIEKGSPDEGCWGSAKDRLRTYLADHGIELLFDEDGPVPGMEAQIVRRTLLIVGTGWHCLTKVLDASTGEDIGAQLGISRIEWRVGDSDVYPRARLIFEVLCPVIIKINPDEEKPGSASGGAAPGGAESDRVDRSA